MALYNRDQICPGLPPGEVCQICPGDTIPLGDNLCEGASRIVWTQTKGPAASQALIADNSLPITDFTFNNNGKYTFKRCCWFDEGGPELPPIEDDPALLCPGGAVVGDLIKVTLIGCDNGTVTWLVTPVSNIQNQGSTVAYITPATPGTMSVAITCSVPGQPDINLNCQIPIYPADQEFDEETLPPVEVCAFGCGERCRCETVDVIVGCDEITTSVIKTPIYFKKKLPMLEKPEQEILIPKRLVGTQLVPYQCKDMIDKDCEGNLCCDTHQPALLWNDVFNCGWQFEAPAINGTSIYNAMGSSPGLKWCFKGPVTINLSGPPQFIDTIVLWGHNMTGGTITSTPLTTFNGNPTTVQVVSDKSCLEGYTLPVISYLGDDGDPTTPGIGDAVGNMSITITPDDPDKVICIQHLFVGRKLFLKNYPDTWKNPFFGADREVIVREGDCGPMSVYAKRRRMPLKIPLEADNEQEYKECYMPILRYLYCPNPVLFAWSINQCPQDLFYGYVDGINDGAEYEDGQCPVNSISASGWIRQPQPKDFQ